MKETYYFSHDYNSRNDIRMVRLIKNNGMEGVGIYWCIIEMLYENGGTLPLSECDGIAFALQSHCDVILSIIKDTKLFENDGENFWSESVNRRLQERNEKSIKASQSANKRWKKKPTDANALRPECDRNAIKEKKRKEKKVTPTINSRCVAHSPEFSLFLQWQHKNTPKLERMKLPLTEAEWDKLFTLYPTEAIYKTLLAMQNRQDLEKKYESTYLTAINWLEHDPEVKQQR